ncbi:hypothetical protein GHK86_09025 [Acidimicrobiaceae bacterium USS-CC1]|uniref:Uncharacterized protein n=1 Tax=Acidiferrimicrobium australe TaxID=2664430 RepID=A0ABW9QTW7_9ACTN|nr:hypothetical protein [Acidiferrimicrobium australe]
MLVPAESDSLYTSALHIERGWWLKRHRSRWVRYYIDDAAADGWEREPVDLSGDVLEVMEALHDQWHGSWDSLLEAANLLLAR